MLESEIERVVCNYAKLKGWLVFKFVSPSNRGVPDRIWLKDGITIFVEFKAPGKLPTKLQLKIISKIKSEGFSAYVIDNIEEGKKIVDNLVK